MSDDFSGWGHPVQPAIKVSGPGIQSYEVVTVNSDGTVDLRNRQSRATRTHVPGLAGWTPTNGDLVLGVDVGGDPQDPAIVAVQRAAVDPIAAVIAAQTAAIAAHAAATVPYAFAATFIGPWGTTNPGPTVGPKFTLPRAATVEIECTATAFIITAGQSLAIEVWIDGVNTGVAMTLPASITNVDRRPLSEVKFTRALTAGDHYIAYKQTAGTSNTDDSGAVSVILP